MDSTTLKRNENVIELPVADRKLIVDLIKQLKSVVDNKMFYLMDGLTIDVADALFEEMRDMEEQESLTRHFNIMRVLKLEAGTYRQEFGNLMNYSWTNLINGRDQRAVGDAVGPVARDLELYSRKHTNHYKILLEEVRQRFCGIALQDLSFHPMLPANFYLCFWYATEPLGLKYEERRLIMSLFQRFVMDRYGQVLAAVNDRMKALDIIAIRF